MPASMRAFSSSSLSAHTPLGRFASSLRRRVARARISANRPMGRVQLPLRASSFATVHRWPAASKRARRVRMSVASTARV